jgi:hypothetical protein
MNRLISSPQNLGKTEPLTYIEATRRAGDDAQRRCLARRGLRATVPYLDTLPEDIDISVEAQIPPNNAYTGLEWAEISVERIRKYLARYHAAKGVIINENGASVQAAGSDRSGARHRPGGRQVNE